MQLHVDGIQTAIMEPTSSGNPPQPPTQTQTGLSQATTDLSGLRRSLILSVLPPEIHFEILRFVDWRLCLKVEAALARLPSDYKNAIAAIDGLSEDDLELVFPNSIRMISSIEDPYSKASKPFLRVSNIKASLLEVAFVNSLRKDWIESMLYLNSDSLKIVQYFYETIRLPIVCGDRNYWASVADIAGSSGSFDVIFFLIEKMEDQVRQSHVADRAAGGGHLKLVEYLHEHQYPFTQNAMDGAAQNGHMEVVRYLYENRNEKCSTRALETGSIDVIKFMHQHYEYLFHMHTTTMDWAAQRGHLDVLQFHYDANLTKSCTAEAIAGAAQSGHLHVVKWLHEHGFGRSLDPPQMLPMDAAASGGHLDVLLFLHEKGYECTKAAMDLAAAHGHSKIVQWLHENRNEGCSTAAMNEAVAGCHIEIVKFLHHLRTEGCTTTAMAYASSRSLHLVKFLHENRSEGCTKSAMNNAAYHGRIDILKFLHHNRKEGCTSLAMDKAAMFNHLGVVRFLHQHRSEGCTKQAMDRAASRGHIDMVRFLHFNRTEGCTQLAMEGAASRGHLGVVRFLHEHRTEGFSNNVVLPDGRRLSEFLETLQSANPA
ncbi:hypothetical protein HDU97_001410 [Phlyctochytrium planicorne]|nr:hypothetical protein HDU97_001410 [Phlyctochytrium planicorne]